MYYNTSILVAALTNHNDKLIEENKKLQLELDQANAKIEVKDKRIKELEAENMAKYSAETTSEYLKGYKDGLDYAHNFVAKYLNEVRK